MYRCQQRHLLYITYHVTEKFQGTPVSQFFSSFLQNSLPSPISSKSGFHIHKRGFSGVQSLIVFHRILTKIPTFAAFQQSACPFLPVVPLPNLQFRLRIVQKIVYSVHFHDHVSKATERNPFRNMYIKDLAFRYLFFFLKCKEQNRCFLCPVSRPLPASFLFHCLFSSNFIEIFSNYKLFFTSLSFW